MGKQGQPPWKKDGYGGSYAYWSGAWKSPRAKAKNRPDKPPAPTFPSYDAGWQGAAELTEITTRQTTEGGPPVPTLVNVVQHAVNQARKTDQRLSKLRTEALKKSRSWDAYALKLQQSYAREKGRHVAEQKRLSQEIQDTEAAQTAAYAHVRHVVLQHGLAPQETGEVYEMEWEALVEDADVVDSDLRSELARIMGSPSAKTSSPIVTPLRPTTRIPRTPHSSQAPTATTPTAHASGQASMSDPYMCSPGLAHFGVGALSDGHGSFADAVAGQGSSVMLPQDAPTPGSAQLAEKLQARKQENRRALAPFGTGKPLGHNSPAQPTPSADQAAKTPRDVLIDDDHDGGNATSPGLGRME